MNHTGKSYWQGKIWRIRVSAYVKYILGVSVDIGKKNFSMIRHFSPAKIFLLTVHDKENNFGMNF